MTDSEPETHNNFGQRRVTFQLCSPRIINGIVQSPETSSSSEELGILDFEKLEEDLGPGQIYFFEPEPELVERERKRKCKMWCCRISLVLLFVLLLILGLVFPAHLQQYGNGGDNHYAHYGNEHQESEHESHYGYGSGRIGPSNDYGESDHVAPPTTNSNDQSHTYPNGYPQYATTVSSTDDDGLIVVRHEVEPPTAASEAKQNSDDNIISQTTSSCQANVEKLDSVMEAIAQLSKNMEKMQTLLQSSVLDEQIADCVVAIGTGNLTLSLKHWNQILKYDSSPERKLSVMRQLIKESYNGDANNILKVAEFIEGTKEYYGYSLLYKEIQNYGQFLGHSEIFSLALKTLKSCGKNSDLFKIFPSSVQTLMSGEFTLQNKFNKGFLYYAKKCVARHYYYCLDVLTKLTSKEEFDAMEKGGDECRRYHWNLTATDSSGSAFFILNHDKYWSYRLQDLSNSPRFKMEESGNAFEIEMSHFSLLLVGDDEIKIKVKATGDAEIYLEGEEFKSSDKEVLLHSYHKTENADNNGSKVIWIVKSVEDKPNDQNDQEQEENDNCKPIA